MFKIIPHCFMSVSVSLILLGAAMSISQGAVNIIWDTDLGDADDAGACAVLNVLADQGEANILANGGPVAALALFASIRGDSELFPVGIAAAIAAATADTASSEIGQVHGSDPVILPGFKNVPAGTPGAVSFEGPAAGLGAAVVIGLAAAALGLISLIAVPIVAAAAALASAVESAVASRAHGAGHHLLNLMNVSLGACLAMAAWAVFF